jgi:hypothetical protein
VTTQEAVNHIDQSSHSLAQIVVQLLSMTGRFRLNPAR